MSVDLAPLLPIWLVALLAGGVVVTALLRLRTSPLGALMRCAFAALCALFLLGPEKVRQTFDSLPDQALILLDGSASMSLGDRTAMRDAVAERLRGDLEELDIEVAESRFGDAEESDLAAGLTAGLSAVNRDQLAGVFVLTDGRVTGADELRSARLDVPLHGVLIGDRGGETDRSLTWLREPRFGLLGQDLDLSFELRDTNGDAPLPVALRVDGELILERMVTPGETTELTLPMERPGERIVELSVPMVGGELTARNNKITARVNVIRDRLRVLLISGQPHAGERVWRNVLKSDPAVDLVHYTILKPADKIAPAAEGELNLIAFPSRELFLEKLPYFNVVIFDRYTYRGVITSFELAEVTRFVENGGAALIAAGPEFTEAGSLAAQPALSYILPALPAGPAREGAFLPERTELGERHPITSDLGPSDDWGRWLRHLPSETRRGDTLMTAGDGAPLLVTDRVGEGRIAMLLSDHLWLWARGFDGGGPHREFLRRLVHWLMAEPELEEEALTARLDAEGLLTIERRTVSDEVALVELSGDGVANEAIELEPVGPGRFRAVREGVEEDSVRLATTTEDGRNLTTAAIRERSQSPEYTAVTVTDESLGPAAGSLGGGVVRADQGGFGIRRVAMRRETKAGDGWLGVVPRDARAVLSERRADIFPRWVYAVLAALTLLGAWLFESGRLAAIRLPRANPEAGLQKGA